MKKVIVFVALFFLYFIASAQQFPSMAVVIFKGDKNYYHGKILEETTTKVKIQFIPSGSIYEINNLGVVEKSTGKYKAGSFVNFISLHDFIKDVYNEENAIYPYNFVGIRFSDGKLYYGLSDGMLNNQMNNVYFSHSGKTYSFVKQGEKWKVSASNGAYPVGNIITCLYMVQNFGRLFYTDGTFNNTGFTQRKPSGTDN